MSIDGDAVGRRRRASRRRRSQPPAAGCRWRWRRWSAVRSAAPSAAPSSRRGCRRNCRWEPRTTPAGTARPAPPPRRSSSVTWAAMRAQLIELTPPSLTSSRKAWSLNIAFTRFWQSSKVPSIATAWMLVSFGVVIIRRCTSETRPLGNRMMQSTAVEPRNASIAAPPVSPEVAPTMVSRSLRCASVKSISRASNCIARSLKASVGPWNSSSTKPAGRDLGQRRHRLMVERGVGLGCESPQFVRRDGAAAERAEHRRRDFRVGFAGKRGDHLVGRIADRPRARTARRRVRAPRASLRRTEARRLAARGDVVQRGSH